MAVWLSGFVFLFCCQPIDAKPAADSCPLKKMGVHCDMAEKQNTASDVVDRSTEPCVDCCAFLPIVFDKTRKIEQNQKQIAVVPEALTRRPAIIRPANFSHSLPAIRSRVSNRHGTYLRNCVFRI